MELRTDWIIHTQIKYPLFLLKKKKCFGCIPSTQRVPAGTGKYSLPMLQRVLETPSFHDLEYVSWALREWQCIGSTLGDKKTQIQTGSHSPRHWLKVSWSKKREEKKEFGRSPLWQQRIWDHKETWLSLIKKIANES